MLRARRPNESVMEWLVNGEQTERRLLRLLCNDWPSERVTLLGKDIELGGDTDRWGRVRGGRPYVIEVTLEVPGDLSELISVADELSVI